MPRRKAGWGARRHSFLRNGEARRAEVIEHGLPVHRMPDDDRMRDESETQRLGGLRFLLPAADDALVRHKEQVAEGVQGFALLELGIEPAPSVFTLQRAQENERLHQTAIVLPGTGQDMLPGRGLSRAEEERGGHPGAFEGAGQPQEGIPVPQDEVLLDDPCEAGGSMPGLLLPGHAGEQQLSTVPEAGGTLQAKESKEGKDACRLPTRLRGMLDHGQCRGMVQDRIADRRRIADGRRHDLRAVLGALIGRPGREGQALGEAGAAARRRMPDRAGNGHPLPIGGGPCSTAPSLPQRHPMVEVEQRVRRGFARLLAEVADGPPGEAVRRDRCHLRPTGQPKVTAVRQEGRREDGPAGGPGGVHAHGDAAGGD